MVKRVASNVTIRDSLTLSLAAQGDASSPTVVFLPGPIDSWRSYEPVLNWLPPSIRAIAVSQRGHGDSTKPAFGYGVEDFASDLVLLLDALDIERPLLVGHSGSCFVVRCLAIGQPHRVAGLVLEASPTTLAGDAAFEEFVGSVVMSLDDPIDPEFAETFMADTSSEAVGAEVLRRSVEDLLKVPARVWHQTFDGLLDYDDLDRIDRIAAATMLIWGDADRLVRRQAQDILEAAISRAELVIYSGAGHTPKWDDPERFASDIDSLIMRVT